MLKVLIVSITPNSAVDRLAEMVQKNNEHLLINVLPFHAKRYNEEDLKIFEQMAKNADLIDFEYWRSVPILVEKFPWLKEKPMILTHHNPYDLHQADWKELGIKKVVVKNKTQQKELSDSILIPHAVDLDFFEFNESYKERIEKNEKPVIGMVAYRIEGKKGIREVAQVCKELNYKLLLVGHVSKPEYMRQIVEVAGECLDFREDVSDEELRDTYKEMDVMVCNSIDNFETGTLPILEAMAMGVPVLTRNIGLVPDINDEQNLLVRLGTVEDTDEIKNCLESLIGNKELRLMMREKAWQTIKNYNSYRMAKMYAKLYNQVAFPVRPLVSIITPTYNRKEQMIKIIEELDKQTYKNIELVVCDDCSDDGTEEAVKSMRESVKYPIKYLNTQRDGYNLAMARNMGVIEADGDYLVFLDSRLLPDENMVAEFISHIGANSKLWLFGEKGGGKTTFVENFSMIKRNNLIRGGMFNERIDRYGGMSQEVRQRFIAQEFEFLYVPTAIATEMLRAQKVSKRRKDIILMKNKLWKMNLTK